MKKFAFLAVTAAGLFAASALQAQTTTTTTTENGTRRTTRTTVATRNNARVTGRLRQIERNSTTITAQPPQGPRVDGSAVRTVRSGNPLQMINPFAPKEYGTGTDVTRHEADDPYQRPQGLQLFAVQF